MNNTNVHVRATGTTLAAGGILLAAVFVLHGPPEPTVADQMHAIEHMAHWSPVYWIAAAALSLLAMAGFIALTAKSRLTKTLATTVAWVVVPVGALGTDDLPFCLAERVSHDAAPLRGLNHATITNLKRFRVRPKSIRKRSS